MLYSRVVVFRSTSGWSFFGASLGWTILSEYLRNLCYTARFIKVCDLHSVDWCFIYLFAIVFYSCIRFIWKYFTLFDQWYFPPKSLLSICLFLFLAVNGLLFTLFTFLIITNSFTVCSCPSPGSHSHSVVSWASVCWVRSIIPHM